LFDPFDDESPEDKTTRHQEGNLKEEAKLEEGEEAIWSSCSVWEGSSLYEDSSELVVGDIHVFSMETSHPLVMRYNGKHDKLRIPTLT